LILFSLWRLDSSLAQDATGKIEGTLKEDPQGAVVPNASVTVTNLGTGAKSLPSRIESELCPRFAPHRKYRLTVEASNFSKYVRRASHLKRE
jgi:hypothetical protein